MVRGNYNVNNVEMAKNIAAQRDTSCRSMICAFVVVTVICVVLILCFTIPDFMRSSYNAPGKQTGNGGYDHFDPSAVNRNKEIITTTENQPIVETVYVVTYNKSTDVKSTDVKSSEEKSSEDESEEIIEYYDSESKQSDSKSKEYILDPLIWAVTKCHSTTESKMPTSTELTTEFPTSSDFASTGAEFPTSSDFTSTGAEFPTSSDFANTEAERPTNTDFIFAGAEFPTTSDFTSTELQFPTSSDLSTESEFPSNSDFPSTESQFPTSSDLSTESEFPSSSDFPNMNSEILTSTAYISTESESEFTSTDFDHFSASAEFTSTKSELTPNTDQTILSMTSTEPSKRINRDVKTNNYSEDNLNVCITPACKTTASSILNLMNLSSDPCENFYQYSCGGLNQYLSPQNILKRRVNNQIFNELEKNLDSSYAYEQFKQFYNSCLEFNPFDFSTKGDVAKAVKQLVNRMSGNGEGEPTPEQNTDLLTDMIINGVSPFFEIDLTLNSNKSFIFTIMPPSVEQNLLKDYQNGQRVKKCERNLKLRASKNNASLFEAYKEYIDCIRSFEKYEDTLYRVSKYFNIPVDAPMSTKLFDLFKTIPNKYDKILKVKSKEYTLIDIRELEQKFPMIKWIQLLSKLTSKTVTLNDTVQFYFYTDEFFDELSNNLKSPKDFHNILLSMYSLSLYIEFIEPDYITDEEFCKKISIDLMPDIASQLYLNSLTSFEGTKSDLTKLFSILKMTLSKALENDTVSRLNVEGIKLVLPDTLENNNNLDKKYQTNDLKLVDNFAKDIITLIREKNKLKYQFWSISNFDQNEIWSYFLNPFDTMARSISELNIILMPMGMFPTDPELPEITYVSLGKMGYTLAQEIASLHVSSQRINDKSCWAQLMNQTDWMSDLPKPHDFQWTYHQTIIDQIAISLMYNTFIVQPDNLLNLPWISREFSKEKLLYIMIAQHFCTVEDKEIYIHMYENVKTPAKIRVNRFITNDERFSTVFSECKKGSLMNSGYKCGFPPYDLESDGEYYDDPNDRSTAGEVSYTNVP